MNKRFIAITLLFICLGFTHLTMPITLINNYSEAIAICLIPNDPKEGYMTFALVKPGETQTLNARDCKPGKEYTLTLHSTLNSFFQDFPFNKKVTFKLNLKNLEQTDTFIINQNGTVIRKEDKDPVS
jgi:hypothetical protein